MLCKRRVRLLLGCVGVCVAIAVAVDLFLPSRPVAWERSEPDGINYHSFDFSRTDGVARAVRDTGERHRPSDSPLFFKRCDRNCK
jgi:hypothetical protein